MSVVVHKDIQQGSEAWERIRKGKATGSNFSKIVTPAKLQFAAGARTYACSVVAELLGVDSVSAMPTFWMEHGTEMEPFAREEYERIHNAKVEQVGFVMPSENARCGYSPDGLTEEATIELKCPMAETLIAYHAAGVLPKEYRLQVQSALWISGKSRCDFMAWHPEIEPFEISVEPEPEVFAALDVALPKFNKLVDSILAKVSKRSNQQLQTEYKPELVAF